MTSDQRASRLAAERLASDSAHIPQIQSIIEGSRKEAEEMIEDGCGTAWSAWCERCGRKSMQVVRPGKAQCSDCGL